MPRAHGSFACLAAVVASASGLDLDAGLVAASAIGSSPAFAATKKYIAGVPVLNYEKAYASSTQSMHGVHEEEDWIVALRPGSHGARMSTMCRQAKHGCSLQSRHEGCPFIALHGTEDDLAAVVGPARDIASYIEPNAIVEMEPVFEEEAMLQAESGSSLRNATWGLRRIGADKAEHEGEGVHVYVIDTGIRMAHEEFEGRAFKFADFFVDTTDNSGLCEKSDDAFCSEDYNGHGTHCAGTVAGATLGVAPKAKVYSGKVFHHLIPTSTAIIIGTMNLVAETKERPAVMSMSLGGWTGFETWKTAVDAAVNAGVTVVCSAGNNYNNACLKTPAFALNSITVGSTDSTDARSGFSNFGDCVTIWAPGTAVNSADGRNATDANDATWAISGTSMACPHVAGAAAVLLSGDSSLTPAEVRAMLLANASMNYLSGLSPNDTNNLLYIGNDAPEAPSPVPPQVYWPSPEFFASCIGAGQTGPVFLEDICVCSMRYDRNQNEDGTTCYNGDEKGCPVTDLSRQRNRSGLYFYAWNCTSCRCLTAAQVPVVADPTTTPETPFNFLWILIPGLLLVVCFVVVGWQWSQQSDVEVPTTRNTLQETELPNELS